ncbi:MAG: histone deacetylase family protein, partial [Gammaproteobacteria bacterium]
EGMVILDPDTAMNPHSLKAALRAAGAVVHAVEAVVEGKIKNAFCNVRPPGHHAERARAMGFCIFNNAAVGAAHALSMGLSRVAICDFDVHHGNGTEDIFRDEPRVLLCSTFQHPFYPFKGADTRSAHIVNVPLPAGTGSEGFREAVKEHWLPALEAFRPEMLLFSAGFDAHRDDPLAGLSLVEEDYAWVTEAILPFSGKGAVSTLEGGYNLKALGKSAAAHIRMLL